VDTNNVYWAATNAAGQKLMGLKQSNGAIIATGWPVTTPGNVTTSSPTLSTVSGTTTLYLGVAGDLLQLAVTGTTWVTNTSPGTVTGRVSFGTSFLAATKGTSRVYAGDSSGSMWAISPTSFTGTSSLWSYAAGSAITNNYYDGATDTVAFGTSGGKVVVLNGADGSLLKTHLSPIPVTTDYPFTLDTSDPITAAPLYVNGVLAVATTLGKLYLIDRNTGLTSPGGVKILRQFSFGPTQSVSTVGFDANQSRYMISTSSAANDGRIYYFDAVTDPTPTFQ
jgi:putative pyrroloquinoline-quinone-binding quinoprotein